MRCTAALILVLFLTTQLSECEIVKRHVEDSSTTLVDQFNNYVDQTIDLINKKQITESKLPFYFTKGTWGYLFLNMDYSLKLSNGSLTGISELSRSGDAFIAYNKTTGILTVSATVLTPPVQTSYAAELKVYGFSHKGQVISSVPALNISVSLSVSAANLVVNFDTISVASLQAPNVTFTSANPVLDYFVPLVSDVAPLTDLVTTVVKSSIQSTVDVLNSPNFGYY